MYKLKSIYQLRNFYISGSKAEGFWRQLLKGFTAPTPLLVNSTLTAEPEAADSNFGDREIRLSEQTTAMLQSLAQQHQLTLNTLVQGAHGCAAEPHLSG